MTSLALFGFCGASLVGLGLYGVLCHPGALRKIIALNLLDSGVFLLFGVIARRGGGSLDGEIALSADPIPQALVITGLIVAFAATALGVALVLRLAAASADAEPDTNANPGLGIFAFASAERDEAPAMAGPEAAGYQASGATNPPRRVGAP